MNDEYQEIYDRYNVNYKDFCSLAQNLKKHLSDYVLDYPRIDRIDARAKEPKKFAEKAFKVNEDSERRYKNPFVDIQDQIGARIITYYLSDVDKLSKIINGYYDEIEEKLKRPKSFKEFSYISKHFILFIPDELRTKESFPLFFELQVKTLFQHAWAEAEHDINYKTDEELAYEDKQYIAFSSAQAWGADKIFNDLFKKYNK